jgi:hypothetical protein
MTPASATLLTEKTFNRTERSGFMSELDEQEWGLCDHNPVPLDYEYGYGDDWEDEEEEEVETPYEVLADLAADIEAGRAEVSPGWNLDRPSPGVLVWTTPSGLRFATTLTGQEIPVPGT